MTEKQIIEGNILIAEFMGGIYSDHANAWGFGNARIEKKPINIQGKIYENAVWAQNFEKDLKYHYSWDSLVPVLQKIEELDDVHDIEIHSNITSIHSDTTFTHFNSDSWSLNATWECIVDFIKWYNTIKK